MSGPIHKLIGLAKTRLLRYIVEPEKIFSLPIQTEIIEDEEINTEDLIECMNNNVSILERCNQEWDSLLKDMEGEGKVHIIEPLKYRGIYQDVGKCQ